jgi:hypothetical protein
MCNAGLIDQIHYWNQRLVDENAMCQREIAVRCMIIEAKRATRIGITLFLPRPTFFLCEFVVAGSRTSTTLEIRDLTRSRLPTTSSPSGRKRCWSNSRPRPDEFRQNGLGAKHLVHRDALKGGGTLSKAGRLRTRIADAKVARSEQGGRVIRFPR